MECVGLSDDDGERDTEKVTSFDGDPFVSEVELVPEGDSESSAVEDGEVLAVGVTLTLSECVDVTSEE